MDEPRFVDRTVPFEFRSDGNNNDGWTLDGYAAVFNSPTRITGERHRNAPDGVFDERIAPGAFKKTFAERGPVLMFDHGQHPLLGSMPLGPVTAREDPRGAYVKSDLHRNWLIQPVRDAIASHAIEGMSFRFQAIQEEWDTRSGDVPLRTIKEAKVLELGPVVFPAYRDTSVAVRSMLTQLDEPTAVEIVRSLRDMSETQEVSVVDQIKQLVIALMSDEVAELQQDPDATGSITALLNVLADLDWYEMVDAMEDADMGDEMNSSSLLGTSRRAALRTLFGKPHASTEPHMHSGATPGQRAALLRSLQLPRSA